MTDVDPQRGSIERALKNARRSSPVSPWPPASCEPHQPLVRQDPLNARASKRPSGNIGSSSLGQCYGEARGDQTVG